MKTLGLFRDLPKYLMMKFKDNIEANSNKTLKQTIKLE